MQLRYIKSVKEAEEKMAKVAAVCWYVTFILGDKIGASCVNGGEQRAVAGRGRSLLHTAPNAPRAACSVLWSPCTICASSAMWHPSPLFHARAPHTHRRPATASVTS